MQEIEICSKKELFRTLWYQSNHYVNKQVIKGKTTKLVLREFDFPIMELDGSKITRLNFIINSNIGHDGAPNQSDIFDGANMKRFAFQLNANDEWVLIGAKSIEYVSNSSIFYFSVQIYNEKIKQFQLPKTTMQKYDWSVKLLVV